MNPLQIAMTAAQIFSMVEPILQPFIIAGVKASTAGIEGLIASLQAKKAAGVKMTMREVSKHAMDEHGVDMAHVYRTVAGLGIGGVVLAGTLAAKALRR